jgi:hypothetical protein
LKRARTDLDPNSGSLQKPIGVYPRSTGSELFIVYIRGL